MRMLLICSVLILVLIASATLWRASRNEARSESAFPPLGQFVTVDGLRLHYEQFGDGPDLVLIHGSAGNIRDMTFGLAPALQDRYRVTVFDRPGLGYSQAGADQSITEQARVLAQASRQIGLKNPVVLGQSYGGSVALAWGLTQPDIISGLILVSAPSMPWSDDAPFIYKANAHPIWGRLTRPLISAWVPASYVASQIEAVFTPQPSPGGYSGHIGAGLTLRRASLQANALQRVTLREEVRALAPKWSKLDLPVYLIHGDADQTVGLHIHALPLSQSLPNAELIVINGVGHMPHQTHMTEVISAIDRAFTALKLGK